MNPVEDLSHSIKRRKSPFLRQYGIESLIAVVGSMLVTGIIYVLHLYPTIPNISILYLLVILWLASTRGRYAAILASLVAFFSFDYFLVPPIFKFTINRIEEWLALFVFLVTALLTSQLAVMLRQRAEEANRREREARILYELMRTTNNEEQLEHQLSIITKAVVAVFASWGIQDCALLLHDAKGLLTLQASARQPIDQIVLSPDEQTSAVWVMAHGQSVLIHDNADVTAKRTIGFAPRVITRNIGHGQPPRRYFRLIPLKMGQKVIGVLRLQMQDDPTHRTSGEWLREERERLDTQSAFFWTFLDQAASVIERARLRRESLRMAVLERTDALRMALLSSVSHDLRTPLSSIKAAASSLLQVDVQWDDEIKRSFARTIEHETDRLNHLVSNLLDMSRIEEGALKPEKELYLLDELIVDVLSRMEPILRNRTVHTEIPTNLPPVEVDYLQMDQVLTNLIENAVRYTPPDSPIEMGVRAEGEQVVLTIADRGPGIPSTDLERIFDKFYRVLPIEKSVRYPSGSGLGLAVCKGLVEAHGGQIWAEAREGGGSVFSVALPASAIHELESMPAEAKR